MAGLRSPYLCGHLYPAASDQHILLGNCRDHYDIYCNLWNADGKKADRQRMGMCICLLLHLECHLSCGIDSVPCT